MAIATGCVVAGAILSTPAARSVMTSAASSTAQQLLQTIVGGSSKGSKTTDRFLSSRIQAKLECILHLFYTMEKQWATTDETEGNTNSTTDYQKTMWNRVFCEMSKIKVLVDRMKVEQEEDTKGWFRRYWPRSQMDKQLEIIQHLETIEEIIRFVSMVAPYIKQQSQSNKTKK